MTDKTLLEIAQAVAIEIRYPEISSVFGNSSSNVVAIFDAIKKAAERDVFRAHDWAYLLEFMDVSGATSTNNVVSVSLPVDYDHILAETAWDAINDRPAVGGLTDYEWNSLFYSSDNVDDILYYRIRRESDAGGEGPQTYSNYLQLAKIPNGQSYQFVCSYKRSYFVVDGVTGEPKATWSGDTDKTVLDSELIVTAATVRMLRSLGRGYGDQAAEYQALLKDARQKNGAVARTISMNGRKQSDYLNIPNYPPPVNSPWRWRS